MTEEIEYYTIESSYEGNGRTEYRFRSLFNNCVGSWSSIKEKAIEQGEKHKRLIERYINACAYRR